MRSGSGDQPTFRVRSWSTPGVGFDVRAAVPAASHIIGREETATIRLQDERVSRKHAQITRAPGGWTVQDLGSRSGTHLNGRRLAIDEVAPLGVGSVLTIGPFELRMDDGTRQAPSVPLRDDAAVSIASPIAKEELGSLASRRLEVLLELAGQLHRATELDEALDRVAEALLAGTGYTRALIVRDGASGCERLAARATTQGAWGSPLSRTLLAAARTARAAVRIEDRGDLRAAVSIAAAGVSSAICIPILPAGDDALSFQTVAYLDSPGGPRRPAPDAAAFARAACELAALAMESAARRALESEVTAMREVQLQMMPPPTVALGPFQAETRCVPGRGAAGDVIGCCATAEGGAVLMVGDVSGKGPAAAMLMASVVSHLDASLSLGASLIVALRNLNEHVLQRFMGARFVTAALIHVGPNGSMQVCDLGHGIILRVSADGVPTVLAVNGGPPLGVHGEHAYEVDELVLREGERIVVCSDGVTEQRGPSGEMFGFDRALAALGGSRSAEEDTQRVLDALRTHAAQSTFDDDVTVVSVARRAALSTSESQDATACDSG